MSKITYVKLKIILLQRGLKLSDIGSSLGFSSATVSRINKDDYVSLDTLARICEYLSVDIGDICELKKNSRID